MKISTIHCNNNTSFKAGKTFVYSDFDGTFMPYSHNDVCNNGELSNNREKVSNFNDIYRKFMDFSDKAGAKLKFILTTGRNMPELDFILGKIKNQDLKFPQLQTVIIRNGGDRFERSSGQMIEDQLKIDDIEQLAKNWDGKRIKSDLTEIIKRIKSDNNKEMFVLNVPINKHEADYEDQSVQHIIDNTQGVDKKYYASFSDDGVLAVDLVFPKNIRVENIKKAIEDYFNHNDISATVAIKNDNSGYNVPSYHRDGSITVDPAQTVLIKPEVYDKELDKLFDVRKEVKNNLINNTDDLVIAAGDGMNDEPMLNIFNYLDLVGVKISKGQSAAELLEQKEVLDGIRKLPFAAVIVGPNNNLEFLRETARILQSKGINKIFIEEDAQNGILGKVKEGMLNYSKENEAYKYSLGAEVFEAIVKGQN